MVKRSRYRDELAGEPVIVEGNTYRPVGGYGATTYGFKSFGLFKSSGRPLRVEIESGDGAVTVVPIRDLQSMVMGALFALAVVSTLFAVIGRRG